MNTRAAVIRLCALAAAVAFAGCQNPFDPEADVRVLRWDANGGIVAQIVQIDADLGAMTDKTVQRTSLYLGNFSSVSVLLTTYTVVYRQVGAQDPPSNLPAGSAIPSLGGAAGLRFPINFHVQGISTNQNVFSALYASAPELQLRLVTRELLLYIKQNPGTLNGGIDCEVECFGTDENGHDVKVSGTLHVEVL